jgi:hypothetical protein
VRGLGYRVFLDVEQLDHDADAYFQIPQFISSLQDCTFYLLLLTRSAADLIGARNGKTSWIHDEYQHACRLTNAGRLLMVPLLLESDGMMDPFTPERVIDMTTEPRDYAALRAILAPHPHALGVGEVNDLADTAIRFDTLFLSQRWDEAADALDRTPHLAHTFDHGFRRMLHAIYTANAQALDAALEHLHGRYGQNIVSHLYKGYCAHHRIPDRSVGG